MKTFKNNTAMFVCLLSISAMLFGARTSVAAGAETCPCWPDGLVTALGGDLSAIDICTKRPTTIQFNGLDMTAWPSMPAIEPSATPIASTAAVCSSGELTVGDTETAKCISTFGSNGPAAVVLNPLAAFNASPVTVDNVCAVYDGDIENFQESLTKKEVWACIGDINALCRSLR